MEIGIFIDGHPYPYAIGGAEIFSHQLANWLVYNGCEVSIIGFASSRRSNFYRKAQINYNFVVLPDIYGRVVRRLFGAFKLPSMRKRFDVVLSVKGFSALLGGLLARGRPHIIRFSGGDLSVIHKMTKVGLAAYGYLKLGLKLNSSAYYVVLTNYMKKLAVKAGVNPNRIFLIPNFVEDRFYKVNPLLDDGNILFVGTLKYDKGVDILAKAFVEVAKRIQESKLILVGSGPLEPILRRYVAAKGINRRVVFAGKVPYEEVHKYFELGSVFVLPSPVREGMSNSLLQAMAAGLPVIATDIGGMNEVIINGENGLLVPPNDSKTLANTILTILKDKNLRHSLHVNAKETAKNYRIDKIAWKYFHLFKSLVSSLGGNKENYCF